MTNRILLIQDELDTDPLGRGYAGMSDQAAADDLNTAYRTYLNTRLLHTDLFNAVDPTEYEGLSTANKDKLKTIINMGGPWIDVSEGTTARSWLLAMFPAGSTTRTTLQTVQTVYWTRGDEIGAGYVSGQDVTDARAIP